MAPQRLILALGFGLAPLAACAGHAGDPFVPVSTLPATPGLVVVASAAPIARSPALPPILTAPALPPVLTGPALPPSFGAPPGVPVSPPVSVVPPPVTVVVPVVTPVFGPPVFPVPVIFSSTRRPLGVR